MGRAAGQTNDRHEAMIADCMNKIAKDNITNGKWVAYGKSQYNITARQCQNVWKKAWERIKENFSKDTEENLMMAVLRLDDLFLQARDSGYDFNSQLNIVKEKNKLLGLHTERQEIKQNINLNFEFDDE